jgi:hypothetical protein
LKYGGQRDAVALAVAELTSVRHIHDEIEIEIGYDADRSTSPSWCRTPWTATRWSPTPPGFRDGMAAKWLSVSARARDRSWRGWLYHQMHVDDLKPKADDPLYKPGECGLVGQLSAEGGHLRACGDLAVVKLCAQRSAGLAAESDLIRV